MSNQAETIRLESGRTGPEPVSEYWFTRHSKSVIFLTLTLALVGAYLVFTIPVSVFPETNFPRVIISADNEVMPIDQMMVTITRPIEEAVNSVQDLEEVRSITSRGSAEVDLFFNWKVDMFQTLQRVNSALARIQSSLPPTVKLDTHPLTFASFPIMGYSLTSPTIPQTQLWELATYEIKPRLNRLSGVASIVIQGGEQPEFQITPDPAKLLLTQATVPDILDAAYESDRFPGAPEPQPSTVPGAGQWTNTEPCRNLRYCHQEYEVRGPCPHPGCCRGGTFSEARVHDCDCQRQACRVD